MAAMNEIVMVTFSLLYTPGVARLFAKEDHDGIQELYWRTTVWIAVLSFPVFALTFSAARPLTVFLYGERYMPSGSILAILSMGYYFQVLLGLNGHTLRVFGRLGYIVNVNIIAAVTTLTLNLLLIPPYGAVGAAVATAASMMIHHALRQLALHLASGRRLFTVRYVPFYLVIAPAALALVAIHLLAVHNLYLGASLGAVVSCGVLFFSRKFLNLAQTFPELMRFPIFRRR
jgi:O-antigen/teichoic acid export membrane protein